VLRTRVYGGVGLAIVFAAGAAGWHLASLRPQSFAECLLVNAREARTADAIPAIAQACESMHPDTAKNFGVTNLAGGEGQLRAGR
jgi:hypothetical protein